MSKFRELLETRIQKKDTISMSVPLFIRLMEYSRESAKTDIVLHKIAERAKAMDKILGADDYDTLVPEDKGN